MRHANLPDEEAMTRALTSAELARLVELLRRLRGVER